jgi:xylulokinase
VRPSTDVAGALLADAAGALGLPAGLPVVIGAGDRACEVLGTGATGRQPMVSWGTTANVSLPVDGPPAPMPPGFALSRGARHGHLLEAGLSAAGAAVEWLARITGQSVLALADAAALSPPGARGVVALPWLNGARAPWWQPGSRAAFVNLTAAHDAGDLARAVWEAIAFDVARCVDGLDVPVDGLVAAGGGVAGALWLEVLAATTNMAVTLRRSGEAASGACLLAEPEWSIDRLNPVTARVVPDAELAARSFDRRPLVDRVADTVARLDLSEWNVP